MSDDKKDQAKKEPSAAQKAISIAWSFIGVVITAILILAGVSFSKDTLAEGLVLVVAFGFIIGGGYVAYHARHAILELLGIAVPHAESHEEPPQQQPQAAGAGNAGAPAPANVTPINGGAGAQPQPQQQPQAQQQQQPQAPAANHQHDGERQKRAGIAGLSAIAAVVLAVGMIVHTLRDETPAAQDENPAAEVGPAKEAAPAAPTPAIAGPAVREVEIIAAEDGSWSSFPYIEGYSYAGSKMCPDGLEVRVTGANTTPAWEKGVKCVGNSLSSDGKTPDEKLTLPPGAGGSSASTISVRSVDGTRKAVTAPFSRNG